MAKMKRWGKIGSPKSATRRRFLSRIRKKTQGKTRRRTTKGPLTHLFGKRKAQSISYGKGYYVKAGRIHKKSHSRDLARKSKHTRKAGSAAWRGDLKGSRI